MIDYNQPPPKGFYFREDQTIIGGSSWEALLRGIFLYRQRVGKPIGNPEADLEAQLNEWLKKPRPQGLATRLVPPMFKHKDSLKKGRGLMQHILKGLQTGTLQLVGEENVKSRQEICKTCSYFSRPTGCKGCGTAIYTKFLKRQVAKFGFCKRYHLDLTLAAHVELLKIHDSEAPVNCWMATTASVSNSNVPGAEAIDSGSSSVGSG